MVATCLFRKKTNKGENKDEKNVTIVETNMTKNSLER